jgi:hypothetical protein
MGQGLLRYYHCSPDSKPHIWPFATQGHKPEGQRIGSVYDEVVNSITKKFIFRTTTDNEELFWYNGKEIGELNNIVRYYLPLLEPLWFKKYLTRFLPRA